MKKDEFIEQMKKGLDIIMSAVDEYDELEYNGTVCIGACKHGEESEAPFVWAYAYKEKPYDEKLFDMIHFNGEEWKVKV